MTITELAEANFERHIKHNSYPGRGLVVGRSSGDGAWLMVYWIMGRSPHSRNRRFVAEGSALRTEPVDASLVEDPSLIIYDAMLELPQRYLIGNGDQVLTISNALQVGGSFDGALATREREPDAPHYTPRISAMLDMQTACPELSFSILKANPADPEESDRFTYRPAPPPSGLGLCLTTYMGDGSPLPSFTGEPLVLPCGDSPEAVLNQYWEGLDSDNRISIAVKHIPADGSDSSLLLHNRYETAPPS